MKFLAGAMLYSGCKSLALFPLVHVSRESFETDGLRKKYQVECARIASLRVGSDQLLLPGVPTTATQRCRVSLLVKNGNVLSQSLISSVSKCRRRVTVE